VLGVFSRKLCGNPLKNKVVAYLATHNAEGSSGNTAKNVEDTDLKLFLCSAEAVLQVYSL